MPVLTGWQTNTNTVLAAYFIAQQSVKSRLLFLFSQKGMVHNIEENKKLYKYLERGKGHLRHQ